MKRLAFYAVVITVTLGLLILSWQFRSVVILLILSLVLAAALRPSVDYLVERGLRASLARLLVYLVVIAALVLGLYLISGPLLRELQLLSNYLVLLYDSTYRVWSEGSSLQQAIAARMPAPGDLGDMMGGPVGAAIVQFFFGVTQNVATIAAGSVVVIALSLYWSADRSHFERLWLSLLPASRRIQARRLWQTTEATMGAYLRSEIVQSLLAIVLLSLGYWIIGMYFPLLMGLLAGIAWLIPMVGFVFAALVSFVFGLVSVGGLLPALAALALTGVVLAFLEFVVEPRIFRRSQFSGVLIILIMVMMVEAYGLIGFIIAPPLAVALQVLGSGVIRVVRRAPAARVEFETLDKRLADVSELYDDQAGPDGEPQAMPPDIASLHKRLRDLLGEARQAALEE